MEGLEKTEIGMVGGEKRILVFLFFDLRITEGERDTETQRTTEIKREQKLSLSLSLSQATSAISHGGSCLDY